MKSVGIALFALLLCPVLAGAARVGTFTGLEGNVDVLSPGKGAVTVTTGDRVQAGDIIRTKSRAKCEVALLDGSVVRVAQNSRLRVWVDDRGSGRRPVKLELLSGRIENIVTSVAGATLSGTMYSRYGAELRDIVKKALAARNKPNYEVHTPNAVYSMRGTHFFAYYLAGASGIIVTEGTVKGYSANKPGEVRTVSAGQEMIVTDGSAPPSVRPVSAGEAEIHRRETALAGLGEGGKPGNFAGRRQEEGNRGETMQPADAAGSGPLQALAAGPGHTADVKIMPPVEASFPAAAPEPPQQPIVPHILTDIVPPEIVFSGTPANDVSGSSALSIGVSANEPATFTYTLNGVTVDSPDLAELPEGGNTLIVAATDRAGNTASKSYAWTTDYTAPAISLSGMPAGDFSGGSALNIGVSASEQVTYTYTLNGVPVASPQLAGLPEGSHTLIVTAVDRAGNETAETYSWITDYSPPVVAITDLSAAPRPGKVTDETWADFSLSAADPNLGNSYFRLNGGAWQPLADTVLSLDDLAEGKQRIEFKAGDLAGNESAIASYEWYIGGEPYDLSGGLSGTLAGSIQPASEGLRAPASQPFGAWLLDYSGGNDQAAVPSLLDFAAGGIVTGPEGTDEGYWLSKTGGAAASSNLIAGSSSFLLLSPTKMGSGAGAVTGTYGADGWQVQDLGLGTYTEEPLALGTGIDASYHYYDNALESVEFNPDGYLIGLLGTAVSPFLTAAELNVAGEPVGLLFMGESTPSGGNTWWGELIEPYLPGGDVIPLGLIGGRTTSRYGSAPGSDAGWRAELEGFLVGLYIDRDGKGGILEGSFGGDFYPQNSGLFAAAGTLRATPKSGGFGPADSYSLGFIDGGYYGRLMDGAGNEAGSVVSSPSWGIYDSSWGYLGSFSYWLEKNYAPEPWGMFNIELGGNYLPAPGVAAVRNWQLHLGGTSLRGLEESEYWLAETENGTWTETNGDKRIAAGLTGRYLTPTALGTLNGRILGSYDTGGVPGTWEAVALGTFEDTEDLMFVSDLRSDDGLLSALAGGPDGLWSSTNTPVTMMGAWDGGAGIRAAPFFSENFREGTATTYDHGAYSGFSSLLMDGGQGVDGGLIALYVDPDGEAGYLKGTVAGGSYGDLQIFSAEGSLTRLAMEAAPEGVDAAGLAGNIAQSGQVPLSLTGVPAVAGFQSEMRSEAWIAGVSSWGIWQSLLEGNGADAAPGSWAWQTAAGADATLWTNYADMTWTSATSRMTGTAAGAKADWINASTYVFGGEIKGLFDPATAGWKAVSQGAVIETARFLDMTAANPAALQAMNIPAVQVGSVTLRQEAGTVNNLANVTMDNVRFFATSTGSVPRLWATNNVGGNYVDAGPLPGGAFVPLNSGAGPNNITADFGITSWGNGNWGAQIMNGGTNGGATVGGFGIRFQGGAAGRTGAGSFTGTGAGIVQ